MVTQGDKILNQPLNKVGGKGLFVKELEQGLLSGVADIAVHSMKDVPVEFPDGLTLAAVLKREDPRDVWVSEKYSSLSECAPGTRIGTSSLRRQCQLMAHRTDIQCLDVRGNVGTRLGKLDRGEFDALVLAGAGLKRLGLTARITNYLDIAESLPAIGQGAIGIECRQDEEMKEFLQPLNCDVTADCIAAERSLNSRLQGGCQVPIAGFATLAQDMIELRALVGSVDGKRMITACGEAVRTEAETLGFKVAESLLIQGAGEILSTMRAAE